MIPRRIQELEGFGTKNVLLISGVALVLFVFAISQKPFAIHSISEIAKEPQPIAIADQNSSTTSSGAVLGAVTYDQSLASVFSGIKVNTSQDNSISALQNYGTQINTVADNDNLHSILVLPPGSQAQSAGNKFLNDIENIAVPDSFADYHRMLIAYFGLRFAAQNGVAADQAPANMSSVIESLKAQLQTLQETYQASNITLLTIE